MYMSLMTMDCRTAVTCGVYDAHQALWRAFGDHPDRTRDFIYRQTGESEFLAVSARQPDDADGVWSIRTKEYEPKLHAGDRLYFALRVNPVRKTRDANGRQIRHDVVQDARKKLEEQGVSQNEWPTRTALAQQTGFEWLAARQERLGLEVEEHGFLVDGYTRESFVKSKAGRRVYVTVLDMKGFAIVTDPDLLLHALMHGIGPAKAYGCGLLTVKRAA
ncbi:type I-E CRISPR-associated protein Cas6/Cse3/CasE [Oceanidesulfovibrio marinus]|uniref:Type I-E CRISPR-associated protein Cas6/Cse3/CasE n=1 Tax=Oceanidesulfovibrio marinus TaxID=370038 RepID=A0ABX6NEJ7_9BACT|nr:type I-E CRISPR-associated protein Cas6/Cse3/CasE [Oceanidesulfovibrio marinus]QJT08020.1 type I-E CRISPR-associated protein Cas6/Cse3/CasE [Oceanidesulfovibrio marinus]